MDALDYVVKSNVGRGFSPSDKIRFFDEICDFSDEWVALKLRAKDYEVNTENPGRYIYLMEDLSNGLVKIGCSKKPKQRESTLLGDRISIFLIFAFRGNRQDEHALHTAYEKQRVRGEWFRLTAAQIYWIVVDFASNRDLYELSAMWLYATNPRFHIPKESLLHELYKGSHHADARFNDEQA